MSDRPPSPTEGNKPRDRIVDEQGRVRFQRLNAPQTPLNDLYHWLLVTRWPVVVGLFGVVYLAGNLLFSLLYLAGGEGTIAGARPGSFADVFFFSVQTMTTIGYGALTPAGTYANLLVTLEAFLGLMGFAMATGIVFAKFARPSARVLFSRVCVVDHWQHGERALKFRMANGRANQIAEATVTVNLVWNELLDDGSRFRRFHELKLIRHRTPMFAMTWTAVHPLDEDSPLAGMNRQDLERVEAELLISISGIDETFAQNVQARRAYVPAEIIWDAQFADVITIGADGKRYIDYARMHDTVPHVSDAPGPDVPDPERIDLYPPAEPPGPTGPEAEGPSPG